MARRHASPEAFELVGMGSDPTPGDPDLIRGVLQRYSDIGDAAEGALNVLRKGGAIESGRGSAMDKLAEMIGEDLPDKLRKTATSYQEAARAYREYIPRLEDAQATFDQAVDRAQAAAPQANQAAPAPLAPDADEDTRAAARRTEDAIEAGQAEMSAARSLAEQARSLRETAQAQASETLDRAAGEAIPERNIFQKIADFFKEFPFVEILLGLLIAVVAVFFPVVGALLSGALFLISQVSAIANGEFELGTFLLGLATLIPGGSLIRAGGGAARGGAEIASGAAGAVRTADGPLADVASSAVPARAVGPGTRDVLRDTGADVGLEAGAETVNQVAAGEGLDPAAIAGAGAVGRCGWRGGGEGLGKARARTRVRTRAGHCATAS